MLKGQTREAGSSDPAGEANGGGSPHLPGANANTRGAVSIPRPSRAAQRQLPRGPRVPTAVQLLGFWYLRERFFERCRARYGNRFTFRLRIPSSVPIVSLSNPDEIKEMFLAPADALYAGDGSAELEKYFGQTGLAFMEEDEHLERRKLLNRSAHGEAVERLGVPMAEVVASQVGSWPRDEVIEMHPRLIRLAVSVMRIVSFGPAEDERLDELVDVHLEMMRFADSPFSHTLLQTLSPTALRVLTAIRPLGFQRFFELRARADQLIREVVDERRRAVDEGDDGDDLVSLLRGVVHEDGTPLSWTEVRDEIVTTFVAGSESTAATLAFAIERLAHDDRVRERLVEEIDAGDDDSYLTATVQEILRLKPIVPMIPRLVMKPVEIGGVRYPPGTRLWGNAYLLHTDPSIYPDPRAFRPERFLDEQPGTYTWIPFGGGRRRCLGRVIALQELKCVLREVLSRYELRPERPQAERPRSRAVVYLPGRGVRVTLADRSKQTALAAH